MNEALVVRIDDHEVRVDPFSPRLAEAEMTIWRSVERRGLLRKRMVYETVITNFRVFRYNHERGVMDYWTPLGDTELVATLSVAKPLTAYRLAGITSRGVPVFLSKRVGLLVTGFIAVVFRGRVWDELKIEGLWRVKKLIDAAKQSYLGGERKPLLEAKPRGGGILEISPLDQSLPAARLNLLDPNLVMGEHVVRRLVEGRAGGLREILITCYRVFERDLKTGSVLYSAPLNRVELFVVGSKPVRKRGFRKPLLLERDWLRLYRRISGDSIFRVGCVVVLAEGSLVARWEHVLDPDGLKGLIDAVRLQLYGG